VQHGAPSCDPAWASQTEIGNKNDTLEETVFQCRDQIFNRPPLSGALKNFEWVVIANRIAMTR